MPRRREYVSFFRDVRGGRRREFSAFEGRRGIAAFLLPLLVLTVLGVSIWWYAVRDDGGGASDDITLEDVNVPNVLFPLEDAELPITAGGEVRCTVESTEWSTFQGNRQRTGCTTVRAIASPIILWEEEVGVQGWLNSPIVVEVTENNQPVRRVIVGSAGTGQGSRDNSDGVYALDLATGQRKWFFGAELDVNGVGYADGTVVATGDEGRVWALSANDGRVVWSADLEAATFGNPLTIGGLAVIGDADGRVTAFDIRTGAERWQVLLDGPVRAGPSSDGEVILVHSELRDVMALSLDGSELWRTRIRGSEPRAENSRLWAASTIIGNLAVFGILRDDVYVEPAVIALDITDGSVVWEASDAAGLSTQWGNVRASVAAVEGLLLFAPAYSDQLFALDTATGETLWSVTAGLYCFNHWPSPAVVGDLAIVPRQDGGLYAISIVNQVVQWKIYLGNRDTGGRFPEDFEGDYCNSLPEDASAIQASPAVASDGTIIVGTLDGRLIAITDRDW
ncbi:MAG: PQQ-binding-like beta-propeller repeat protein [Acidimicrobiia bacterium]